MFALRAYAGILFIAITMNVSAASEVAPSNKTIANSTQQTQQSNESIKFDTSSLEKAIRESIKEASEKPDLHADEKVKTDEDMAKYTKQLSFYTCWLVVFTAILALVAIWQGVQLKRSLDLAREEFISTHRPKIILRNFQIGDREIPDGKPINVTFIAQNIGDSVGKVVQIRSATVILDSKEKIPTDFSFLHSDPFQFSLKSGEKELFPANGNSAPEKNESVAVYIGSKAFYCLGLLVYEDAVGTKRETGYCRRYFPREGRWEIVESEYEYAY
jgi:hypothetical protein